MKNLKFLCQFKSFFRIIIFLFFSFPIIAQRSEFKFQYRFGFPINNIQKTTLHSENVFNTESDRSIQPLNDQGMHFGYKYNFSKKYKLFINFGYEASISTDYLHIHVPEKLDNVVLTTKRRVYYFGVKKQLALYQDKIRLEFGVDITKRIPVSDEYTIYRNLTESSYDWIDYEYRITTYSKPYSYQFYHDRLKRLNFNYNLSLIFPIKERWLINFGFEYTGNLIYYYKYKYTAITTYTDNSVLIQNFNNAYGDDLESINKKYVYVSLGISYKFNVPKKLYSWLID